MGNQIGFKPLSSLTSPLPCRLSSPVWCLMVSSIGTTPSISFSPAGINAVCTRISNGGEATVWRRHYHRLLLKKKNH